MLSRNSDGEPLQSCDSDREPLHSWNSLLGLLGCLPPLLSLLLPLSLLLTGGNPDRKALYRVVGTQGVSKMVAPSWNQVFSRALATQRET